jgi:hypothetical protein
MDFGTETRQVEVKSGMTVSDDSFKGLRYFASLNKNAGESYLIYGGEKSHVRDNIRVLGWMDVRKVEI